MVEVTIIIIEPDLSEELVRTVRILEGTNEELKASFDRTDVYTPSLR